MGGKSGDPIIVGYWYRLGVQAALCHKGVDKISQIMFGERTAWTGAITQTSELNINKRDLFGGEKREGGVAGRIAVYMGEANQEVDRYISAMRGETSAQRGLCTMVFGDSGEIKVHDLKSINFNMSLISPNAEERLGLSPRGILTTTNQEFTRSQAEQYIGNFHNYTHTRFIEKEYDELDEQYKIYGTWRAVAMMYAYRCFVIGNLHDRQRRGIKFNREQFFSYIEYDKVAKSNSTNPFWWSAMNPYFKPFWVRVQSIFGGWTRSRSENCWYPEKAAIQGEPFRTDTGETLEMVDMNPAHIIYKILTNKNWGMGYSDGDIDDNSFRKAADRLYMERFGLSFAWRREEVIEDFIGLILNTISATLRINMISGKFELVLIRNDYVVTDLPILDENNILNVEKYERSAWGETPNEIVLGYTDRMENKAVITVQNIAAIETQGGIISATVDYLGIHEAELAARVAQRELNMASTPLARVTLKTNRIAFLLQSGDVFRFKWQPLGVESIVMRVLNINKGTFEDGTITIEAVEDAFSLPLNTYIKHQETLWQDPYTQPVAVRNAVVWEAPYYDIVQRVGEQAMRNYDGGFTFARVFVENPSGNTSSFQLMGANADIDSRYKPIGKSAKYTPTFRLLDMIDRKQTIIPVTNAPELSENALRNAYIVLGDEVLGIRKINSNNGTITVTRGNLDTLPQNHFAGEIGWIVKPIENADTTFYAKGEKVYYRPLPITTRQMLSIAEQKTFSKTLIGRSDRPFPVANVHINNEYLGETINQSSDLRVRWSGRDRKLAWLVSWDSGHITPETDVTYSIRVYDVETNKTLHNETGLTVHEKTFSPPSENVKIQLPNEINGLIYHYNFENKTSNGEFPPVAGSNRQNAVYYADVAQAGSNPTLRDGATAGSKAIVFSSSQRAVLPFDDGLNSISLTIGVLLNPQYAGGTQTILAFEQLDNGASTNNRKWAVQLRDGGRKIRFALGRNYDTTRFKYEAQIDKTKGFQFVLFRADSATGYITCWIDGKRIGSVSTGYWTETTDEFVMRVQNKGLKLGFADMQSRPLYNVPIDDIFVYNRALSDAEIQQVNRAAVSAKWQGQIGIEMKTVRNRMESWQTFQHIITPTL